MPSGRYRLWGRHVLDAALAHGSDELRGALADVIDMLERDPFNQNPRNAFSITPYTDPIRGGCYVVALGHHGLLKFQVMKDYRVVRLLDILIFQ